MSEEKLEGLRIYTSKKKSLFLLLLSLLFAALGLWLLLNAEQIAADGEDSPLFVQGIGLFLVLVFAYGIKVGTEGLIKSSLAVIMDPRGLNLQVRRSPTDFIPWGDIVGFNEISVGHTRLVMIGVRNPEHWIERASGLMQKKTLQINMKTHGAPFSLGAAGLDITSDELNEALQQHLEKYGTPASE